MRRAPLVNSERNRAQSRSCPAGPEITWYRAAMMDSMEATSADRAARDSAPGVVGVVGVVATAAGCGSALGAGAAAHAAFTSSIRPSAIRGIIFRPSVAVLLRRK